MLYAEVKRPMSASRSFCIKPGCSSLGGKNIRANAVLMSRSLLKAHRYMKDVIVDADYAYFRDTEGENMSEDISRGFVDKSLYGYIETIVLTMINDTSSNYL